MLWSLATSSGEPLSPHFHTDSSGVPHSPHLYVGSLGKIPLPGANLTICLSSLSQVANTSLPPLLKYIIISGQIPFKCLFRCGSAAKSPCLKLLLTCWMPILLPIASYFKQACCVQRRGAQAFIFDKLKYSES